MRKVTSSNSKQKPAANAADMPNYKEFLWYKKHEKALLKQYLGRFLVIKDEKVIADFDSKVEAWKETIKAHEPGSFIIHHCVPVDVKHLPRLANRQFSAVNG